MLSLQTGVQAYESIAARLEQGVAYGAALLIPKSPILAVVGAGVWIYGRWVAITYAPGLLADHFINMTIVFMKSATIGKAVGVALIAPIFTPQVLPFVVDLTGFGAAALVVIIGNLAIKHLMKKKSEEPSVLTKPIVIDV